MLSLYKNQTCHFYNIVKTLLLMNMPTLLGLSSNIHLKRVKVFPISEILSYRNLVFQSNEEMTHILIKSSQFGDLKL